jgi:hypothetical protein
VSFGTDSAQEMCMDFIAFYPRANFDGLKCGWNVDGKTICKQATLNVANPIADGLTVVPDVVSVGGPSPCPALLTTPSSAFTRQASGFVAMIIVIAMTLLAM